MDIEEELTYAQKKQYFKILVEGELFRSISIVEESNKKDKDEIINSLIEKFYDQYKDKYDISCIEEVIAEIENIKTLNYSIKHNLNNEER